MISVSAPPQSIAPKTCRMRLGVWLLSGILLTPAEPQPQHPWLTFPIDRPRLYVDELRAAERERRAGQGEPDLLHPRRKGDPLGGEHLARDRRAQLDRLGGRGLGVCDDQRDAD